MGLRGGIRCGEMHLCGEDALQGGFLGKSPLHPKPLSWGEGYGFAGRGYGKSATQISRISLQSPPGYDILYRYDPKTTVPIR